MKQEQIIKALECCKRDDCDNCPNSFGNCYANLAGYALSLIRELTEENEKLKYTSLTSITMEQALKSIRRLKAEKAEAVHKTIAAVKTRCSRVAYSDMATGHMKESFVIKAQDLDEIEKELTNVYQSKNQRRQ